MSDRCEDRSGIALQDRGDTETILPIGGRQVQADHNARSVIIVCRIWCSHIAEDCRDEMMVASGSAFWHPGRQLETASPRSGKHSPYVLAQNCLSSGNDVHFQA